MSKCLFCNKSLEESTSERHILLTCFADDHWFAGYYEITLYYSYTLQIFKVPNLFLQIDINRKLYTIFDSKKHEIVYRSKSKIPIKFFIEYIKNYTILT